MSEQFYWCTRHNRVEREGEACPEKFRLGPYPSEEEARNWQERRNTREDRWQAEDDAWEGKGRDG
ncbi:MAG TPA: hypothetical protein VK891_03630 [Euzebyales bacterium]|nr:hypothetical protein [Euzebyales bacterium]